MVRACFALGIYIGALALKVNTEVGKRYWSVIAAGTRPFLEWTQHFRGLPRIAMEKPANQHSHLVLIVALFLVSWRLPLKRRLACFGTLAALAVAQDFLAAGLSLRLHEAKMLFAQRGWLMLLPWEYNAIEAVWYLVYTIPLQAAPFLLFLLTALWNTGLKPAELVSNLPGTSPRTAPGSRSQLRPLVVPSLAALFLVAGVVVGAGAWARARERDPLHLRTHLFLGNLHLKEGKLSEAEADYRLLIHADANEGEAWLRLAQVRFRLGERGEAVTILQQAARVVRDPAWMDRIRAGLKDLGSSDPYVTHTLVRVDPTGKP